MGGALTKHARQWLLQRVYIPSCEPLLLVIKATIKALVHVVLEELPHSLRQDGLSLRVGDVAEWHLDGFRLVEPDRGVLDKGDLVDGNFEKLC